jgi:hypothetical protein
MQIMTPRPLPPRDYLAECFAYDPETGVLARKERPRWHFGSDKAWQAARGKSGRVCNRRSKGYIVVSLDDRWSIKAHRIIWKLMTGEEPPPQLDHRDRDRADNRWIQLREATKSQNRANSKLQNEFRGAYRQSKARQKPWCSQIRKDGKLHYRGMFATQEEAARAYEAAAAELHGEFAHQTLEVGS